MDKHTSATSDITGAAEKAANVAMSEVAMAEVTMTEVAMAGVEALHTAEDLMRKEKEELVAMVLSAASEWAHAEAERPATAEEEACRLHERSESFHNKKLFNVNELSADLNADGKVHSPSSPPHPHASLLNPHPKHRFRNYSGDS